MIMYERIIYINIGNIKEGGNGKIWDVDEDRV